MEIFSNIFIFYLLSKHSNVYDIKNLKLTCHYIDNNFDDKSYVFPYRKWMRNEFVDRLKYISVSDCDEVNDLMKYGNKMLSRIVHDDATKEYVTEKSTEYNRNIKKICLITAEDEEYGKKIKIKKKHMVNSVPLKCEFIESFNLSNIKPLKYWCFTGTNSTQIFFDKIEDSE